MPVLEVTGPDRAARRARGKDDALDAVAAAEAARTGCRVQVAKDRGGAVEAPQVLRTTRKTAVKCRRAALQQLHNTIVAAPDEVRDRVRNLTRMRRLRTCAALEAGYHGIPGSGGRDQALAEVPRPPDPGPRRRDRRTRPLHRSARRGTRTRPAQARRRGNRQCGRASGHRGRESRTAALRASFAMLCGACPIPASSGKTRRHRLNRGGNRQANSALHMVVVCRMRTDPRTRAYVARRTREGLSKREVMRCLKRYVAREVYRVLTAPSSA